MLNILFDISEFLYIVDQKFLPNWNEIIRQINLYNHGRTD